MRNRTLLVDPRPPAPPAYDRPSKSQRKRDMTALQDLGARLAALPAARVAELDLPEALADALAAHRQITAHEGARRQMQLIGKLMRGVDPAPIAEALDRYHGASRAEVAAMHQAERWRERLLAEPAALTEFVALHPNCAVDQLRRLTRAASGDRSGARAARHYRELYRMIRDVLSLQGTREVTP
jgi:ribosome-associated protein